MKTDVAEPDRPGSDTSVFPHKPDEPAVFLSPVSTWDDESMERLTGILSIEERARASAIRNPIHRRPYIVAHALVRLLLAGSTETTPSMIEMSVERNRRPEIRLPPNLRSVRVSLSHTIGMIAVAVSAGRDIGVDVEKIDPNAMDAGVAQSAFSEREYREWLHSPAESRPADFFRLWTLKEAFLKATGVGFLANPAEVEISAGPTPHLRSIPRRFGRPSEWTLRSVLHGSYWCSVAHAAPDRGQLIVARTIDRAILDGREHS